MIGDCRFPIANLLLANHQSAFGNWQLAIGRPTRYHVVVLTSFPDCISTLLLRLLPLSLFFCRVRTREEPRPRRSWRGAVKSTERFCRTLGGSLCKARRWRRFMRAA